MEASREEMVMAHDELLARLDLSNEHLIPYEEFEKRNSALRAVVEGHTPFTPQFGGGIDYCWADDRPYPCPTIQKITEELK
jgi:hypothetical protein